MHLHEHLQLVLFLVLLEKNSLNQECVAEMPLCEIFIQDSLTWIKLFKYHLIEKNLNVFPFLSFFSPSCSLFLSSLSFYLTKSYSMYHLKPAWRPETLSFDAYDQTWTNVMNRSRIKKTYVKKITQCIYEIYTINFINNVLPNNYYNDSQGPRSLNLCSSWNPKCLFNRSLNILFTLKLYLFVFVWL